MVRHDILRVQDIKDMLSAWFSDNNTRDWTVGIKFVQFYKNSAFHAGIQQSPYEVMFGTENRNGLVSCSLPSEVFERLVVDPSNPLSTLNQQKM